MWVIDCEDHLKSGIHKKSEPTLSPLKTSDRIGHDESHHFYWLLSNPITCEVGGAFFFFVVVECRLQMHTYTAPVLSRMVHQLWHQNGTAKYNKCIRNSGVRKFPKKSTRTTTNVYRILCIYTAKRNMWDGTHTQRFVCVLRPL